MKISIRKKNISYLLLGFCVFMITYTIYLLFKDNSSVTRIDILGISWLANILFVLFFLFIYKTQNNKISLIHIYWLMGFLFNFGQSVLWSVGIHTTRELGTRNLYGYRVPSNIEIYNAILFSIVCYAITGLGILSVAIIKKKNNQIKNDKNLLEVVYRFSKISAFIIIPLTFAKQLITLAFSAVYGYVAIYYSDFSVSLILEFAERFFFPVLVGILIGGKYKDIKLVYIIFGAYVLICSMSGKRGAWFYCFLVLFWMHHRFYKKIDFIKILKLSILGFCLLYVLAVIVDLRGYGLSNISTEDVLNALDLGNNPIIRFVSEMGGTLGVTIIVMRLGVNAFNFGNTFISSILSSVSSRIANSLGLNSVYLSNYLSQSLLNLNWGTGFNIFAETYINGSIIYMLLLGSIASLFLSGVDNDKECSFNTFIKCIIAPAFCSGFRDESLSLFKNIAQIGIIYPLFILLLYKIIFSKKKNF